MLESNQTTGGRKKIGGAERAAKERKGSDVNEKQERGSE